jgi:hypothetical protein
MLIHDLARAGMEIARTRVIAEPGPEPEHMVEARGGQLLHRRKAFEETLVISRHGFDAGLLQHDFREPHPVGIGRRPGGARHGRSRRSRSYQASKACGSGLGIAVLRRARGFAPDVSPASVILLD